MNNSVEYSKYEKVCSKCYVHEMSEGNMHITENWTREHPSYTLAKNLNALSPCAKSVGGESATNCLFCSLKSWWEPL